MRKNTIIPLGVQVKRAVRTSREQTINVLLISPPKLPGLKASRGSIPVALLFLAGVLRKAGHTPTILDLSVLPIPEGTEPDKHYFFAISEAIRKTDPKLIGINCFSTMHFPFVSKFATEIRKMNPNIPICTGGAHPSFYPREILENCSEFDFIVTGEGEEQIVSLADIIASGDHQSLAEIQSFCYRNKDNGSVVVNSRKEFLDTLDDLPLPAYDMINFSDYYGNHSSWYNPKQKEINLSIPIFTTRSCPFTCSFCSVASVMGRTIRRRTPEKVVDEIEMLVRDYGQSYFAFSDDNVNVDKKHFIAVCDGIVERKLDVQLCIAQGLYLDAVDEEIVRAFVRAGGITVSVPIESGNDFIREKIIGKHLKSKKIYDVVGLLQKYNIFTVGLFIMGFPEDTTETLDDTLLMIERLGLDVNGVSTLIPFPETRIYEQASREKLLLFDDAQNWNGENFFDPQNKTEFFVKPYNLDFDQLRHYRKIFDELYITSERAKSLHARSYAEERLVVGYP